MQQAIVPAQRSRMSPTLAWKTISGPGGAPIMLHQQSQDDEVEISAAGGYGGGGGCTTITQAGITQYDGKGNAQTEHGSRRCGAGGRHGGLAATDAGWRSPSPARTCAASNPRSRC